MFVRPDRHSVSCAGNDVNITCDYQQEPKSKHGESEFAVLKEKLVWLFDLQTGKLFMHIRYRITNALPCKARVPYLSSCLCLSLAYCILYRCKS